MPGSEGSPDIKRRIRAARELAGIQSDDELIDLIDEPGLGKGTLKKVYSGARDLYRSEQLRIAEVCGVPVGWFHVDIAAAVDAATPSEVRGSPGPPGALGRPYRVEPPSRPDPPQPTSQSVDGSAASSGG